MIVFGVILDEHVKSSSCTAGVVSLG
jgi:hypothetical protein